ncbi:MAG: hypothetical protein KAJ55_03315 [Anaerolineales bacterium]|nr:hypothetical protein [Anaerolineales bacterium]
MDFKEWRYLYPPRPESAVTCDLIAMYEKEGWVGQYKKNGTCAVIGVGPDHSFQWMNRHRDNLKWTPTERIAGMLWEIFGSSKWTVLVGELLHSKVKDIRNKLYLFDYIVLEGEYQLGTTFREREKILQERFEPYVEAESESHWLATDDVWLAKTQVIGLEAIFRSMNKPEDEGLVLKDPEGKLRDCERLKTNGHWQVKVRHPKANFPW